MILRTSAIACFAFMMLILVQLVAVAQSPNTVRRSRPQNVGRGIAPSYAAPNHALQVPSGPPYMVPGGPTGQGAPPAYQYGPTGGSMPNAAPQYLGPPGNAPAPYYQPRTMPQPQYLSGNVPQSVYEQHLQDLRNVIELQKQRIRELEAIIRGLKRELENE